MLQDGERITSEDISILAALHQSTLESSIISALGVSVLKAYYRYIVDSTNEFLFVIRDEGSEIVGACVLSSKPQSLTKRFLFQNLIITGCFLLYQSIVSSKVRKKVYDFLFEKSESPSEIADLYEVIQIYTSPSYRGKGGGSQLLTLVEEALHHLKIERYYLKTLDDEANKAIRFYENQSFQLCGRGGSKEKPYVYFIKNIA